MFAYFLLPIACFYVGKIYEFKRVWFFQLFLLIVIGLFLCGGYMTGSDWRQYEKDYTLIGSGGAVRYEAGYVLLNKVFNELGFGFWPFLILLKLFAFISVVLLFILFSKNYWLALGLFLSFNAYFMFIDNPLRNLMAASFLWLAAIAFNCGLLFISILLVFLASQFHLATLICLPFIGLGMIGFEKTGKVFLTIMIAMFWVVFSNQSLIMGSAIWVLSLLNLSYVPSYFFDPDNLYTSGQQFSVGLFLRAILFFLILLNREKLTKDNSAGEIAFNFSLIYLITAKMALTVPILGRVSMCFAPFFWIAFAQSTIFIRRSYREVLII
ncbi:MAG TPA: EpsG family protein, partial [Candidatus Rifleibacterium sp.]|nr:EpsG family protein [Candidatus Rifleibacterium sp.]